MMLKSKSWFACLWMTGTLIWSSAAQAYVPPSAFLVKTWVTKHSGFKGARIKSLVTAPGNVQFKTVTLIDLSREVLRSGAYDLTGHLLYSVERNLGTAGDARLFSSILFEPDLGATVRALKAAGIPIRREAELAQFNDDDERRNFEKTSLARWMGGVAWVIGGTGRVHTDPEFWLEKDKFLPVRLIARGDSGLWDAHYDGYRTYKEFPYPKVMTLFSSPQEPVSLAGGTPGAPGGAATVAEAPAFAFREELQEFHPDPSLAELKSPQKSGLTAAGESANNGLRDAIASYYRWVR